MVEALSKLICEYATENKKIDPIFISEVVNTCIVEYNVEDYIKGIIPFDLDYYCAYSINKLLKVNVDFINDKCLTTSNYLNLSSEENNYYKYITVVQKILHELEHAKQHKQIIHIKKDLETIVLIASLSNQRVILTKDIETYKEIPEKAIDRFFREQFEIYKKYYRYAPEEKMAEINSMKQCLKIVNNLVPKDSKLNKMYRYLIYNTYLNGYENDIIPTKFYLEKKEFPEFWEHIDKFSTNYSYLERAKTGCTLTVEEKEKINEKKMLILKGM